MYHNCHPRWCKDFGHHRPQTAATPPRMKDANQRLRSVANRERGKSGVALTQSPHWSEKTNKRPAAARGRALWPRSYSTLPPGSCTVGARDSRAHGVGKTIRLVVHQARHRFSDVHWLYHTHAAVMHSRATGSSTDVIHEFFADTHRSVMIARHGPKRSRDRGRPGRFRAMHPRADMTGRSIWTTGYPHPRTATRRFRAMHVVTRRYYWPI